MLSHRPRPWLAVLALAGIACPALAAKADLQGPGSQLVFQQFDNRPGMVTLFTVTNLSDSEDVRVYFEYRQAANCLIFNRTEVLTAADTITLVTSVHSPSQQRGFAIVQARDALNRAIVFNHLVGTALWLDGVQSFESAANAVSFEGIGDGVFVDVNGDGLLAMDGSEYSLPPQALLFPRFIATTAALSSDIVLLDLSMNNSQTLAHMLVYNDNEELFSQEIAFACWTRRPLSEISPLFTQAFLVTTNHDPSEPIGASSNETGWFSVEGHDGVGGHRPLLGLLVDVHNGGRSASRPFHRPGVDIPVNLPPVCAPDFSSTPSGTPIAIPVLANDFDPEGQLDCSSVAIVNQPTHGVAIVGGGCVGIECNTCLVVYHPLPGFVGTDAFVYLVSDAAGLDSICQVTVEVFQPAQPPSCPQGVSIQLWPPNHGYEALDLGLLAGVTDPAGLSLTIEITAITQDEPVQAPGSGNTVCDGTGIGTSTASIRRERIGGGNGRVYHIHYTAENSAGLSCSGVVTATVPRSQGSGPAVDDGQLHDSTAGCN